MRSLIEWGIDKISVLREDYRRSLLRKFSIWLVIIIICIIIAFLLEFFFFNRGRFNTNRIDSTKDIKVTYKNFKQGENNYLIPTSNISFIDYSLPDEYYVYKIKLRIITNQTRPIGYDVLFPDKHQILDNGINAQALNETRTVFVDAKIESFSVRIVNSLDLPVKVSIEAFDYKMINNPVRLACTVAILFLIFYTLLSLAGVIPFRFEKITLIYLIVFGVLLVFLVPPRYSWDEYDHFIRSMYTANQDLIIDASKETDFPSTIGALRDDSFRSFEDFERYLKKLQTHETIRRSIPTSASSYLFLPYLISAFGIQIAKMFKLPIYYYMWFGRLANLAVYILLVYFAVKLFKPNKKLFFYLSLLPNFLFLASGLNTSGILNSCLFLYVALIADILLEHKEVTWRRYVLLNALIIMVTICRVTYAPFFLLMWLIPKENFKEKYLALSNKIMTTVIMIGVTGITLIYSVYVGGLTTNSLEDVNMMEQLDNILRDPIRYISVLLHQTFNIVLTPNLGASMGDTQYNGSLYSSISLLCLLLTAFLPFMGNSNNLVFNTRPRRWIIFLTSLISYIGTLTVMYLVFTKVDGTTINGFQPRYLFTIFIVLLPALQGKSFYVHYNRLAANTILCFSVLAIYICFLGLIVFHYYG